MRLFCVLAILSAAAVQAGEEYSEPPITERDTIHWAWQPIRRNMKGTVDSFVLEKLKAAQISSPAPRADDETLLRRLCFTLTGLPPTPEELEGFSAEQIEEKIDELLARPQYGEHWAQHWLDVVRFAETDGFEHDKVRPEAWRYRDWVIDAFNRDLPYDEFVALQIAGDEIAGLESPDRYATGFLLAGPDMPDINLVEERRHNVLNEMTSTTGAAFLGLTMGCAQCHDHKSDPISQADFYRLRSFFENLEMPAKNKSLAPIFAEEGRAVGELSFLRIRGDFRREGPELEPAFLRIANRTGELPAAMPQKDSSGRRTALANWLRSPGNPLVARVIVNRVWQGHFGSGLVGTPNDFGKTGDRPTHPELLDWLASDLIDHGWSLKHLHRTILLSNTWQQTSQDMGDDPLWNTRLRADPDNALFSRRSRVRLSGEEIRDAMLQTSGKLNLKRGGPGIRPPLPPEVTVTLLDNQWPVTEDVKEHSRRSIYLFLRRNLRFPMFDAFDKPDANLSCGRRHLSTTAPQSLVLLNSDFSDFRAKELAAILAGEPEKEMQIGKAFRLVLNREATDEEILTSIYFLESGSLEDFALALYNLNEFVYLD